MCPNRMYGHPILGECVTKCSAPSTSQQMLALMYYADDTTNMCTQNCPKGYVGDPTSVSCVTLCPIGWF